MAPEFALYRWPPPDGPYRLRLWFDRVHGRPSVVGVEMWGVRPETRAWPTEATPAQPEERADLEELARTTRAQAAGMAYKTGTRNLPDTAITAEMVRLPIRRMLQEFLDHHRRLARAAGRAGADLRAVEEALRDLGPAPRGRPSLPAELISLAAMIYKEEVERGLFDPSKMTGARLSKALGRELAPSTVRRWIALARSKGLLPPAPPRKAKATAEGRKTARGRASGGKT